MNIDIFGSCVTRDPFEFDENNYKVKSYFARSSFVSLLYPAISLKYDKIEWPSNFVKRTVKDDLEKRFVSYSNNPSSKIVIIDLIQERYSISKFQNSYYTYSTYHKKANIPKGTFIYGLDHLKLFKENINKIVEMLDNYEMVILHEASLAERYMTDDNVIHDFDLTVKDKYFIEHGNEYYKALKDNLKNVYSLKLVGFWGASNHKWGLSPSHFEESYYRMFNEGLDYIIKEKKDFHYVKPSHLE